MQKKIASNIIKFGDEPPGLFLCGNDCFGYSQELSWILYELEGKKNPKYKVAVISLQNLLRAMQSVGMDNRILLKEFDECKK